MCIVENKSTTGRVCEYHRHIFLARESNTTLNDGRGYNSVVASRVYASAFPVLSRWVTPQWDWLMLIERFVGSVPDKF